MREWNLDDARKLVWESRISGSNLEIASYWLSLWTKDGPPTRGLFDPKRIARHVPALALMAVQPDESVICRLAGKYGVLMSGFDLAGKSLLEFVPVDQRLKRLRNATDIVMGAISIGKRAIMRGTGKTELVEEICLPFAEKTEDGVRHYLVHTNWRPLPNELHAPETPRTDCGFPKTATMLKLPTHGTASENDASSPPKKDAYFL